MLAGSSTACDFFKPKHPDKSTMIARVGEHYLFAEDIGYLFQNIDSDEDSAAIAKTYVEDWIRKKLMVETAKKYLPAEQQNLEKQIEDYRESLLIFFYEDELIRQKLDTTVTDEELEAFYQQNNSNINLDEDIMQLLYIKLPNDAPKLDSIRFLFSRLSARNEQQLIGLCYSYASEFYLKDSIWISKRQVMNKMPVDDNFLKTYRKGNAVGEVSDSLYIYLLKINDYKEKGEVAPLLFVKDRMRFMLINKRKQKLISEAYNNIYQTAIKDGNFEVFNK